MVRNLSRRVIVRDGVFGEKEIVVQRPLYIRRRERERDIYNVSFLLRSIKMRYGCVQEEIKIKDDHNWKRLMLAGILSNHEMQI